MESWSSRVPSSSGVNAVGSVVLSLSDIYLVLDVNSCSVKGFGVFYLPQDIGFIVLVNFSVQVVFRLLF